MLGWSLNLFRVRGIQLSLHSSFFLLLAYVAWVGWQPDPENPVYGGWTGVLLNMALLVAFFTCIVWHELGHSLTAMHFGVHVRRILLMPIGGMAEFDSIPRDPWREFAITAAGPAVNFLIAGLLWPFAQPASFLPSVDAVWPGGLQGFLQVLLHWNVIMGLFNLVPVFPMDGGRILRALFALRLPYVRATWLAATIGKVLGLLGIAAALFAPELGWSDSPAYLLAVLFAFILFAGEMEYRTALRREQEDAHWRRVHARLQAARPRLDGPLDEPPVLYP